MGKAKLFEAAKLEIFGEPPKCKKKLIGYNIAAFYYGTHILEAENTLQAQQQPSAELKSYLKFAFKFPEEDPGLKAFSKKTRKAIKECAGKFKERYAPLMPSPTDPSPS